MFVAESRIKLERENKSERERMIKLRFLRLNQEKKKRNVRKINISYGSCVVTSRFLVMLQWSVTYTTNQMRKSPKYSDGHLHIIKQVGLN